VRTAATVIPVLLAAWWIARVQGALWRRTLWARLGRELRALQAELGGTLRARGAGYELRGAAPSGRAIVRWRGGLWPRTAIRVGAARVVHPGWLDAAAVRAALRAPDAAGPGEAPPQVEQRPVDA
jgi:hypothetical protein